MWQLPNRYQQHNKVKWDSKFFILRVGLFVKYYSWAVYLLPVWLSVIFFPAVLLWEAKTNYLKTFLGEKWFHLLQLCSHRDAYVFLDVVWSRRTLFARDAHWFYWLHHGKCFSCCYSRGAGAWGPPRGSPPAEAFPNSVLSSVVLALNFLLAPLPAKPFTASVCLCVF